MPQATLNNGVRMPMIGLGMYEVEPGDTARLTALAGLEEGYRHIDTAQAYRNEADVGKAVELSGLPREEVFLTTKLSNRNQGYEKALESFEESLKRLNTPYVDLFLLHWPVEKLRAESYRALERLLKEGKARAIGVSNFTVRHLDELARTAGIVPAVNQVEFHPFLYQRELADHCRRNGIRLEAYSPLVRAERMDHPVIAGVASRNGMTPAQVLLSWSLGHGVIVIPKTLRRERMRENLKAAGLKLPKGDIELLDTLGESHRTCWDPTDVP